MWQTGRPRQQISRTNPRVASRVPGDAAGPPRGRHRRLGVRDHWLHRAPGARRRRGAGALRERLRDRGLRLMLDFVPNHTAPDHPWVEQHPDYYVAGTEADLARAPHNYTRVSTPRRRTGAGARTRPVLRRLARHAATRLRNPATQEAMRGELLRIAGQCDGVRCDMAMLVLPDVFERTWGRRAPLFWPETTRRVREQVPGSASWPRSTGTSNGPCSSRGSTTPTTSGSTIACATATPGRCASICTPASTIRTSWRVSWRTTTSRAPPQRSRPRSRGRGHRHLSVPRAPLLPPGSVRRPQDAHLAAPGARTARADR